MMSGIRKRRMGRRTSIIVQAQDAPWKTFLRPCQKTVRDVCQATLSQMKYRRAVEISVMLADDAFVQDLNHRFRGKNTPTNILSFPGEDTHLGDIALAFETIQHEAEAQGKSFRDHTTHLLVHGVLHLLGYDHMKPKEAKEMETLEIKILKKLGVANPYL